MKADLPYFSGDAQSYEGRFNNRVRQEISDLKNYTSQVRLNRLAAYNSAAAAPTGGTWAVGDKVWNSAPAEAGVALSKYVVIGWICTVAGTPGTWLAMRTLTGN